MKIKKIWILFLLLSFLVACTENPATTESVEPPTNPTDSNMSEVDLTATPTQVITPTPDVPMIAIVNGEGISLQDFEDELLRYETVANSLSKDVDVDQVKDIVLTNMIDTLLLAQGARSSGYSLTQESIDTRIQQLITDSGGENQFQDWLTQNNYSQVSFQRLFELEIEATWMRDKIISEVPTREEQIRARQILVSNKTLADDIYNQLENGVDFDYYSWGYDQLSGGELGWFPRNYLVLSQIEDAVFNLQPGEYSEVIESSYGYHIVQVMEHELDRQLTQDALIQKQKKAISDWLESQRASSSVSIDQD
jgi:parvulin-like peptidyl-prolyl isomerase